MSIKEIKKLGNILLYQESEQCHQNELDLILNIAKDLKDTMDTFRDEHGWGRAIAAPQIGVMKRIIFMNVDNPILIINPELTNLSNEIIELWDDCMSFPDLLVKVRRHKSCTLDFINEKWEKQSLNVSGDLSELVQHEFDHLNGVLAIQRAIDLKNIVYRDQIKNF